MTETTTPPIDHEPLFETPESLLELTPEQAALHGELAHLTRMSRNTNPTAVIEALGALHAAYRETLTPADPPTPITALLGGVLDDVAHRYETRQATGLPVMGHRTGFDHLDNLLGGLEPGRISILLAAPGAGKTTLSNQMAYTLAANGVPVLYCSYENAPTDLTLKQLARIAGKNPGIIKRGGVAPHELEAAYRTLTTTAGPRLHYLNATASTGPDTLAIALQAVQATAPGTPPVVILDYLQAMARASDRALGDDMRNRTGTVSRLLTDLAKAAGAHIWAISSVSRGNAGKDGKYGDLDMSRAKESGDLEFDADHVLTLQPAKQSGEAVSYTTDTLTLGIVKNRHGETGAVSLERNQTTLAIEERETTVSTLTGNTYASAIQAGWKNAGGR